MFEIPKLRAERLELRPIEVKDAGDMFEIFSNEEVIRYLSWKQHKSLSETEHVIEAILERKINLWAITLKETGKVVGSLSIAAKENPSIGEVGFMLSQNYWNQGIMKEALTKVLVFGFENMGFNQIEARCVKENEASARLLEKVGFTFQTIQEKEITLKDVRYDAKLFIVKNEQERDDKDN